MTHRLFPLLALVAAVPGAGQDPAVSPRGLSPDHVPVQWAQLSIREHIVIRIPRVERDQEVAAPAPAGEPPRWIEKRGDRCVRADDIAGASVSRPNSIDLMMADGQRARALLEGDCPALDYYYGFYIKPSGDGRVCAGRDAIRSRSGSVCPIRAFRRLVPGR